MAGSKGPWKDFLKFYDKKFGPSISDPARRPIESLAAFLNTFTEDDDLKVNLEQDYVHIFPRQKK